MAARMSHLTVDADGRLTGGEGRLFDLNRVAGGNVGLPLALPAVASIARLSRRLGIRIARAATVAEGHGEIALWVRAWPAGAETRIEGDSWSDEPDEALSNDLPGAYDDADADLQWRCDSAMIVTALSIAAPGSGSVGGALTSVFDLNEDDGLVEVLSAAANRTGFSDRPARLIADGRAVRLSGQAIRGANGAFAGFVGTGRFVEVSPAVDPGDAAVTSDFAERLDRALRTPLQRIVAHADSIGAQSDGPVRTEYVEYAHDIASAARHLMGLVDDLVDLSAIERPDFTVAVETIDLGDLTRRAAGLLAVRAGDADIRIDRPPADQTLAAVGEYRRVLQILVNLVGNAVRYSPRGSTVWLRLEGNGNRAAVIVADQGRGIAPADQTRIFDKFGRVDPHEPGGNGLGLYIARRLARAMGGDIVVESEAGQGARFTLSLPIP